MKYQSSRLNAPGARRPITVAVAAALAILCSGHAMAQQKETMLKEITVTGVVSAVEEAREVSTLGGLTMDKPMAGYVMSSEEIDTIKAVSSLTELMTRVPGVSKTRNMRIADGSKNYTDNRVDGLRVSTTGTFNFVDETNMADIERIEFINGPGSVLQSSYAIGGTINVITRNPPKTRELKISQEVGGNDFYRTDLSGGDTLSNGFGYVFDANVKRDSGWRERSRDDKDSFSVKFGGKPDAASSLYVRLEYLKDDMLYPGQLTETQWTANWQQAQPNTYGRGISEYVTPSLQYKRAVGDRGEFVFSAASRVVDASTYGLITTYGPGYANAISASKQTVTSTQASYRQDFDFAKSRLDVGLENMDAESDAKQYANTFTLEQSYQGNFAQGALSTTTGNNLAKESFLSPFMNYEFSPVDKLRLHLGVRADSITYAVDDRTTANKDNEKTYNKSVPKLGATYEFNANNLVWASYAEGFLAPSVSTLLARGVKGNTTNSKRNGYIPASDLLPEESKTHEIGFRGYLPSSKLHYDVTAYHTVNKNMVLQRDCIGAEKAAPNGCFRMNENVGQITMKGIETALSAPATPWLDVAVSHTLAFVTYDSYKSATADYTGNSYNSSPKQHLNARFTVKPAPGWRAELEVDYESEYFLDSANTASYNRPTLYNLRTSYSDAGKHWSAWLQLLNLTDVKYARRMSLSSTNVRTYTDGYTPLTLRAGVSYNF